MIHRAAGGFKRLFAGTGKPVLPAMKKGPAMKPALKSNSGIEPRTNVRPVHKRRGGLGGWETDAPREPAQRYGCYIGSR